MTTAGDFRYIINHEKIFLLFMEIRFEIVSDLPVSILWM